MAFTHITAKKEIRKLFYARYHNYVLGGIANQCPEFPPLNLTKRRDPTVYIPVINWQKIEKKDLNDNGVHFLHFAMSNITTKQKSFTGGRAVDGGGTRYTTNGIATVEIYFSKSAYQTDDEDRLSTLVQRCFLQQNVNSLWFRNPVIVDLDSEETHFRTNVLAEYEYDSEIR